MDRGERFQLATTITIVIGILAVLFMMQQCTINTNTQDNKAHLACVQARGNWVVAVQNNDGGYGRCIFTK